MVEYTPRTKRNRGLYTDYHCHYPDVLWSFVADILDDDGRGSLPVLRAHVLVGERGTQTLAALTMPVSERDSYPGAVPYAPAGVPPLNTDPVFAGIAGSAPLLPVGL